MFINKKLLFFVFIIFLALSLNSGVAAKLQQNSEVEELFGDKAEADVIIILKDDYDILLGNNFEKYEDEFEKTKAMIQIKQDEVLKNLKLRKKDIYSERKDNEAYDFELKRVYTTVNGFSGKLKKSSYEKLRNNPDVLQIYKPYKIRTLLNESAKIINATKAWSLTVNGENITGKGETICIPDTGVDYTHPALGNCTTEQFSNGNCSKVMGYDFTNDDNDPFDDNGHGTHVAGVVASTDSRVRGIAPDANIVAIKIFDSIGGGKSDDLISAIDWCVNNASKFNISVISMSLGSDESFPSHCDDDDPLLTSSIANAIDKKMTVIAATGNSGTTNGISSPACISNVISVGSTTKNDEISSFSDRWNLPMLFAPGDNILSTVPTGDCEICDTSGYSFLSGTSMATPHIAAAAALLQQFEKLKQNNVLNHAQVYSALNLTGKQIKDTTGSGLTFSRIDIFKALISLDDIISQLQQQELSKLQISDLDIKIDSKKSSNIINNTKIRKDAKPGSKIEIKAKVKNNFPKGENIKIESVRFKTTIEKIDDGDDLEQELDKFDLRAQSDKTITLKFEVPVNVKEGTYNVITKAEGEDGNGNFYEQSFRNKLEVEKEKHNLKFSNLDLSPSVLICNRFLSARFEIINIGSEDEEDAKIEIKNADLGINYAQSNISMNSGAEDNLFSKSIGLKINDNIEEGTYQVTSEVYSKNGKLLDTRANEMKIFKCLEAKSKQEELQDEVILLFFKSNDEKELNKANKEYSQNLAINSEPEKSTTNFNLLLLSSTITSLFFIVITILFALYY